MVNYYQLMKHIPYPRIDLGMATTEKVRILAEQVSAFMAEGFTFSTAMRKVLFDRYNGTQKGLFHEVASHEAARGSLKRAVVARKNAATVGQLELVM